MVDDVTVCPECRTPQRRPLQGRTCGPCRERARRQELERQAQTAIGRLLGRDDVLILDTETTGMRGAEVIELAVMNTRGEVLLDTLVKPKRAYMNPYAERVHGISLAMLEHAPTWQEVFPALCELADRRTLLAWNAPFDAGMLQQTSSAWGLAHPSWLFVCAMRLYAKSRGLRARGLHKAVVDESLAHLLARYPSHRALGDVRFVLEVLRASQARGA